jgi:hypothetical protein
MSTYCVTFRLLNQTIDGKTYDDRRQSILDGVYQKGAGYWEETTSFLMVESALDTNAFAAKASNGLSAKHDMLVAFDPSDMSVAYFGAIKSPDILGSFFRTANKLP